MRSSRRLPSPRNTPPHAAQQPAAHAAHQSAARAFHPANRARPPRRRAVSRVSSPPRLRATNATRRRRRRRRREHVHHRQRRRRFGLVHHRRARRSDHRARVQIRRRGVGGDFASAASPSRVARGTPREPSADTTSPRHAERFDSTSSSSTRENGESVSNVPRALYVCPRERRADAAEPGPGPDPAEAADRDPRGVTTTSPATFSSDHEPSRSSSRPASPRARALALVHERGARVGTREWAPRGWAPGGTGGDASGARRRVSPSSTPRRLHRRRRRFSFERRRVDRRVRPRGGGGGARLGGVASHARGGQLRGSLGTRGGVPRHAPRGHLDAFHRRRLRRLRRRVVHRDRSSARSRGG